MGTYNLYIIGSKDPDGDEGGTDSWDGEARVFVVARTEEEALSLMGTRTFLCVHVVATEVKLDRPKVLAWSPYEGPGDI
ncbi:hypothetical protein [Fimbriiglobus ruber]|uniref:Uncharacterized protein n=1 Tax=Fimbriiglobus ruber TaxID=1908690 RepID=A0A225DD03_9BACT|nr:hypothetical protein [Fimbriiglobus ruber]OWK34285.1 hypothetical protein FRUB_10256 [Fimbriiglobus ruber]